MIKGYATIDATAAYAGRHAPVSYGFLGSTGLKVSQAGFGGYRISYGVSHHEKALRAAIGSGSGGSPFVHVLALALTTVICLGLAVVAYKRDEGKTWG